MLMQQTLTKQSFKIENTKLIEYDFDWQEKIEKDL